MHWTKYQATCRVQPVLSPDCGTSPDLHILESGSQNSCICQILEPLALASFQLISTPSHWMHVQRLRYFTG